MKMDVSVTSDSLVLATLSRVSPHSLWVLRIYVQQARGLKPLTHRETAVFCSLILVWGIMGQESRRRLRTMAVWLNIFMMACETEILEWRIAILKTDDTCWTLFGLWPHFSSFVCQGGYDQRMGPGATVRPMDYGVSKIG